MYVPEKLRNVNKFRDVRLLDGRDLFGRFGYDKTAAGSYWSPDADPVTMFKSKLDNIAEEFDRWREEVSASEQKEQ